MALSNISGAKEPLLNVKSYTIYLGNYIGSGAVGVVYEGRDTKKNKVAAKRISIPDNRNQGIFNQDYDRLMKLDHPNVLRILDVVKQRQEMWIFMPLCEFGDLNRFYAIREVSIKTSIEVMKQIMAGIDYLHNQNIVHRDIKPTNILVASDNPILAKLIDFDLCKCLEDDTSLMTTNVGTERFRAPELFPRTSSYMIAYHRNVDIYSAGLTFLAILQAEKGEKGLVPRIETPMEEAELHAPIGRVIAERIKYKVGELYVVANRKDALTWLIAQMTHYNPEDRLSAFQVLTFLKGDHLNMVWILVFLLIFEICW